MSKVMNVIRTRPAGVVRLILCSIFVFIFLARTYAEKWITVPVDLDEIRGPDVVTLVRATVPEVRLSSPPHPLDLTTLAALHAHYLEEIGSEIYSVRPGSPVTDEQRRNTREITLRFEEVMRKALAETDFPTLQRLALGDGKDQRGNGYLFDAYCYRLIEREVAQLIAAKTKVVFPNKPVPAPEGFAFPIIPGTDRTEFLRACSPFFQLKAEIARQPARGYYGESKGYEELTNELLRNPKAKVADQLMRFQWDSWCGTGMAEAGDSQVTLEFLALLQEGRVAEAVGLSFSVPSEPTWLQQPGRPFDGWRSDLLKYCGFDPETMYLCSGKIEILAASGSERGAQQGIFVVKTGSQPDILDSPWTLEKLVLFLIPGSPDRWDEKDPRGSISAKTQAEIFALMDASLQESRSFQDLQDRLKIFADLARPETKPMVKRLLTHPSTTIAQRAVDILRTMGESHDDIPPAPPVRFRFLMNGQPWRSTALPYGGGSIAIDSEGFGEIPRDQFLDTAILKGRMRFGISPRTGKADSPQIYDQVWAQSAEIATPTAYDETTIVNFTTARLPLEITYGSPPLPVRMAPARIVLYEAGIYDPNQRQLGLYFEDGSMELPSQIAFGFIQSGMYQLELIVPGSARYRSEPFEVKKEMPPVRVKLEKGSDVYAVILAPANARGASDVRLYCDGKDISESYSSKTESPLFSGLPAGHYEFRVSSTAEFQEFYKIKEWPAYNGFGRFDLRDGVDVENVTVPFVVTNQSPALINLGLIKMKATAAMQKKAKALDRIKGGMPRP